MLVGVVLVVFLFLPALYVLSVGPAVWLVKHGYVDESAALFAYKPLDNLTRNNKSLRDSFNWYCSLFYEL